MIKIAAGKYRSRIIATPAALTVPTKSMVREAVGNALTNDLPGAKVLDLFAGSGALGLEALSRGAEEAYFVDSSKEAYDVIEGNIALLKAKGKAFCEDYQKALEDFAREKVVFDIVFLDPPYADKAIYAAVPKALLEKGLLSAKAVVVLEFEGEIDAPLSLYASSKRYHYGRSDVLILRR
jgi:16S rRNA (guanine966-N2)-methyltransferase